MQKFFEKLLLVVSMVDVNFPAVSAEEQSILDRATLSSYDIDFSTSWNEMALIDGNFKSKYSTTNYNIAKREGSKEFTIILPNELTII